MMLIKKYSFFSFLFATITFLKMYGGDGVPASKVSAIIRFTENKNQWDKNILYRAQLDGGAMFLEKNCFTYSFYDKEARSKNHIHTQNSNRVMENPRIHAFRMTFLNALSTVRVTSKDPTLDFCNYFIGNDKTKWAGNVRNYNEVNYTNLYSHINLQILGNDNSVKYNFLVSPKANVNEIKMSYEGLSKISLDRGMLLLKTIFGEINEQRPYAYQWVNGKKIEVACEFILEDKTVHFNFPNGYNKEIELIIDPDLVFACSSGSTADNFGMTATYDADGNLYSGGTAFDQGYPYTTGVIDSTYNGVVKNGRTDVVITKYNSTGKKLEYSTYFGGADNTEIVTSLIVDQQGNLLLYGATGSMDFPVTTGAFDTTFNGGTPLTFISNGTVYDHGTDIYVSKFNATGTKLLASTYIGGSKNDGVNPAPMLFYNYGDQYRGEINLDKDGNICIASSTLSSDFPYKDGFDAVLDGTQDAVVFKFKPDLSALVWSSYLGGTSNDAGYALALDKDGNLYVTGGTTSNDFPMKGNSLQNSLKGSAEAYVAKIKSNGSAIECSTYFGTASYDQSYFVQLDENRNVYLIGQSEGKMPVTPGVYSNNNGSQFITKIDSALSKIVFSTVFGNGQAKPNISPSAFLVDDCENIYVSGWGGNIETGVPTHNMPLTSDARPDPGDGFNFYLFVISKNAQDLLYATYFGGDKSPEHVDGGTSRFDKKGVIYQSVCAGCWNNDDFPVFPPDAWPNTGSNVNHSTGCNNGTFKMNFKVPSPQTDFKYEAKDSCAPLLVRFSPQTASKKLLWDFGNNDTTSTRNPVKIYTIPGKYRVKLYIFNVLNCFTWDTIQKDITVHESINANFDYSYITPCSKEVLFTDSSYTSPVSWDWNFDDGSFSALQNPPKHAFGTKNLYHVMLIVANKYGCRDTINHELLFGNPDLGINPDKTICLGDQTVLLAKGGFEYHWSPATGLDNVNISNPTANPQITTSYTVHVKYVDLSGDTCSTDLTTTVNVVNISNLTINATVDKDTLLKGESTVLHAVTNPGFTVQWIPTSEVKDPTAFDTPVTPSHTTTYTVTIAGSSGCSKSDTVTIYVLSNECEDEDVFVPNTFTPNGDGENDVLYARSNTLTTIYFAVYNRWGELVFETTDLRKGWEGIYKGMKADPAVFAWYVKGKCFNGKEFFKKGNVTLIR